MKTLIRDTELPSDTIKQTKYDEEVYELKLYVVCNNRKSQMALENLKEICFKYLAGKCHIEVVDLSRNPGLAREDQIIAIPTLIRKNHPGRRIIGDLSNPEKVLEILELRISNIMEAVNVKSSVEKNSEEKSESRIARSKKSKDDLQPYIGSDFKGFSKNMDKWTFSLSFSAY